MAPTDENGMYWRFGFHKHPWLWISVAVFGAAVLGRILGDALGVDRLVSGDYEVIAVFSTAVTAFIFMYESMRKGFNALESSQLTLVGHIRSAILVSVAGALALMACGTMPDGAGVFADVLSVSVMALDFAIVVVTLFFDRFTGVVAREYLRRSPWGRGGRGRSGAGMSPDKVINAFEPVNQLVWSILSGTKYYVGRDEEGALCAHISDNLWSVVRALRARTAIERYLDMETARYVDTLYDSLMSGMLEIHGPMPCPPVAEEGSEDIPSRKEGLIPLWDEWTGRYLNILRTLTEYASAHGEVDEAPLAKVVGCYYADSNRSVRLREAGADRPWSRLRLDGMVAVNPLGSIGGFKMYLFGNSFRDINMSGADLTYASLYECRFEGCRLVAVKLGGSDLTDARLVGCDLQGLDLGGGVLLTGTEFDGCSFGRLSVDRKTDMTSCTVRGSAMVGASFFHTQMRACRFESMELFRTAFSGVALTDASMTGVTADRCSFSGDGEKRCDMCGMSLTDSKLTHSEIRACDMDALFLVGTYLTGTSLTDVRADGIRLEGLVYWNREPVTVSGLRSERCTVKGSRIRGVRFEDCDMRAWRIEGSEISDVQFLVKDISCYVSGCVVTNVSVDVSDEHSTVDLTFQDCMLDGSFETVPGVRIIDCRTLDGERMEDAE